jgi:hypothetical protein
VPLHPYEIIKAERWTFGLFTSFTLNLGFFETVVYDAWRARGSRELVLLVDRKGYSQSLSDHRAAGAGQRYRIVPVMMDDGVFHPKIGFLANDKHAVLMVGSGNLTFGGWGKNLELVDVVDSATALSPFAGFRDFLTTLDDRRRSGSLTVPDSEWIATALSKIPRAPDVKKNEPVFIHSLQASISSQLQAETGGRKVRRLIILSPYHDNDGETIDGLATALQARRVDVVAAAGPKGPASAFPFRLAMKSKVQPVVLSVDDKRPVHAKWIEIEHDENILTLTGSVNATRPSMGSTRNAEAAILRRRNVDAPPLLPIEPCSTPLEQSSSFGEETGFTGNVVYVVLDPGNRLRGKILGSNVSGDWNARIVRPGGSTIPMESMDPVVVDTDQTGEFVVEVARFTNQVLEFEPGLQIRMEQGGWLAAGWIQSDLALRSSSLSRLASSVVNLFQKSGITAELREFVVEVVKCMKNGLPNSDGAGPDSESRAPEVGLGGRPTSAGNGRAPGQTDLIGLLFARLGEELTRRKPGRDVLRPPSEPSDDESEHKKGSKELSSSSQKKEELELSLEDMHDRMEMAARRLARSDSLCSTLLVIWFDCAMSVYLRSGDRSAAMVFLGRWLMTALSRAYRSRSESVERGIRRFLEGLKSDEHLVRLPALLVTAVTIEALVEGARGRPDRLRTYHEFLEDYFRDETDIGPQLLLDPASDLIGQLLAEDQNDCGRMLAEILQTETRRSMLSAAIDRREDRAKLVLDEAIFSSVAARAFMRRANEDQGARIERIGKDVSGCPECNMSLSPIRDELRRDLLAICPSCRTMLARTVL